MLLSLVRTGHPSERSLDMARVICRRIFIPKPKPVEEAGGGHFLCILFAHIAFDAVDVSGHDALSRIADSLIPVNPTYQIPLSSHEAD